MNKTDFQSRTLDSLSKGEIVAEEAFLLLRSARAEKKSSSVNKETEMLRSNSVPYKKVEQSITHDSIFEHLLKLLADITKTKPSEVKNTDTFTQLGFDSIIFPEFITRIIEEFNVENLSLEKFSEEILTLNDLTNYLYNELLKVPFDTPQNVNCNNIADNKRTAMDTASQMTFSQSSKNISNPTTGKFTDKQYEYISKFIDQYIIKTKKSYETEKTTGHYYVDMCRRLFFDLKLKKIHYPIVLEKAKGAYVYDVDGNKYIDIGSDMGVNMFGHRAEFINNAIKDQLDKGFPIYSNSPLTGAVCKLLCEQTGFDRAWLCQSGTESTMIAARIARAATNKKKIVMFKGSFHGIYDSYLVNRTPKSTNLSDPDSVRPLVSGIPEEHIKNIVYLDYGDYKSFEYLEELKSELAAVIVEPVQSRFPELQPKEFLADLRRFTKQNNIVLIFDEVITGFRLHRMGAQGWYGIKADIGTYGKVLGGGMPAGAVAGTTDLMKYVDGGVWSFDDQSFPLPHTTAAGGTHAINPVKLAAIYAVLNKVKKDGGRIIKKIGAKTECLAKSLNNFFEECQAPIKVTYCGSIFRFKFLNEDDNNIRIAQPFEKGMFAKLLIYNGIHYFNQGHCFITNAHTNSDIDNIVATVKNITKELISVGLLQGRS